MLLGLVAVSLFLLSSLLLNAHLLFKLKHMKARPQSVEVREFLADITSGAGFLAISRLSPEDFVMRSPRTHR